MASKVAYQGAEGAFGEEACKTFLPGSQLMPRPSFAAVVDAVIAGEAELGMLPLQNSIAGAVPGMEKLLDRPDLMIIEQHELPVRLHLLAQQGARRDQLRIAASHPMALAQCSNNLKALDLRTEEAANTAMAAKALAGSSDVTRAVIASEAAALTYGLQIVRRDVHDRPDNVTTFCVIARNGGSNGTSE